MRHQHHIHNLTVALRRARQPDRSLRLTTEETDLLIQWMEELSTSAAILEETLDAFTPDDPPGIPEGAGPNVVSIFEFSRRKQ